MQSSHAPHTSPRTYLTVFAWLAALTVIEIIVSAASAVGMPPVPQIAILIAIAIVKAALVVLFYMHLRHDSRWYVLILFVGLFFAVLLGRFLLAILK